MADNLEQLSKRQLIELVHQLIGRVEALERENARLELRTQKGFSRTFGETE